MRAKSFGRQLCKNMKKRGVSEKGMSEMTGLSEDDIVLWMKGEALPSLEQTVKLSGALGISVDELIAYAPEVKFHGIDEYTEEEKQAMAEKISADRERKYKQGRIITWVLLILEVIATVISVVFRFNTVSIYLTVCLLILTFKGDPEARYLFVFQAVLTVAMLLIHVRLEYFTKPLFYLVLFACAVRFVGGLLLAFNSSVKEYFYGRYAG